MFTHKLIPNIPYDCDADCVDNAFWQHSTFQVSYTKKCLQLQFILFCSEQLQAADFKVVLHLSSLAL